MTIGVLLCVHFDLLRRSGIGGFRALRGPALADPLSRPSITL